MTNISYPAIFHVAEDVGGYWVEFPDLPGCVTLGSTKEEAYEMAQDALSLWLDRTGEYYEREIAPPSSYLDIFKKYSNELVILVKCE